MRVDAGGRTPPGSIEIVTRDVGSHGTIAGWALSDTDCLGSRATGQVIPLIFPQVVLEVETPDANNRNRYKRVPY